MKSPQKALTVIVSVGLVIPMSAVSATAETSDSDNAVVVTGTSEKWAQSALKSSGHYASIGDDVMVATSELKSTYRERAGRSQEAERSAATPPWKPCGVNDKKNKHLKSYGRQKIKGHAGKTARLRCGNAKWGLKHIKKRHYNEWDKYASMMVEPWQEFADWAWKQTLSHPGAKKYQADKKTFLYGTPVQIKDSNGNVVETVYSYVSVMKGYQNIVTAFTKKK